MRLQPSLILALLLFLTGCTVPGSGDGTYRPWVGQHGKDVMWVPTLDPLVLPMLEAAKVTADDVVYDLGSGDGKIPIWAARRFGVRAVGIEYNADLVALARRNVERAGVSDRVRMIHGDIFVEDFSSATVLTLFLGPELNQRLRPVITKMRPGTRVVSNLFDMGDWEPDRVVRLSDQNPLYLWIVPARVDGEWEVAGLPDWSTATLELRQTFQKVEGRLRSTDGRAASVLGRLDGSRLSFGYRSDKGETRTVAVDVRESEFIFELGRYLTAEAGIYVTRVISSKMSRGKAFFACDGGLHHHLAAAVTFGAALRTNFELCNLTRPGETAAVCNIAGPSCNPTDLLGVEITLPRLSEGDLIGVLRSGSYGFTASPLLFLGRPTPAELVRRRGEIVLGRRSRVMSEFN